MNSTIHNHVDNTYKTHLFADFTLIDVIVQSISGGICVSCYFTSDSTAEGCAIQLYNDENIFIFNISRLINEMALLECFSVPKTGTFNVLVYESGSSNKWRLPHITTNAEQVRNGKNNNCSYYQNKNL